LRGYVTSCTGVDVNAHPNAYTARHDERFAEPHKTIKVESCSQVHTIFTVLGTHPFRHLFCCHPCLIISSNFIKSLLYPLTIVPPLGWIVCPLMELLSGLARNTNTVAISLGCDGRPIGAVNCFCASSVIVAAINGVQTGPGATAFTRTPLPTYWFDKPRVKDTIAPLVDV